MRVHDVFDTWYVDLSIARPHSMRDQFTDVMLILCISVHLFKVTDYKKFISSLTKSMIKRQSLEIN